MGPERSARPRLAAATVAGGLADFPAVLLVGARQVGKSTLAQQMVAAGALRHTVTLDEQAALSAALGDPQGFVAGLEHGTAIDEVQRAPALLRAIKLAIDRDRRPGRFLLTGSANVLALPSTTESLAGRAALIELEGFSIAESTGRAPPSTLLDVLLGREAWSKAVERLRAATSKFSAPALRTAVFFGGYPEVALRQRATFHDAWFRAYLSMYVDRDVRDLARIPDVAAFGTLFRLIASAAGQLANMAQLGNDARLDQRTAARYAQILELTFQVQRLQPWFRNVRKRLVKTARLYLRDSGFACHMLGVTEPGQLSRHPAASALCKTWVFGELRKVAGLGPPTQFAFFREHAVAEVNFVAQRGSTLAAIDVKLGQSVTADDFRGVHKLREVAGPSVRGVVLYGGEDTVSFGEGLAAVPFGVLTGKPTAGGARAARRRA